MPEAGTFSEPEQRPPDVHLGLVTKPNPKHPDRNEDCSFAMSTRGAIVSTSTEGYNPDKEKELASGIAAAGVFDGMGGYHDGDKAADLMRRLVMETLTTAQLASDQGFQTAMLKTWTRYEQQARQLAPDADTTATVAWVFEQEGKRYVATAQTGDSRAYKLTRDGRLILLTQDHNFARYIFGETYPEIASFITDTLDRAPMAGKGWREHVPELEEFWKNIDLQDQELILNKLKRELLYRGVSPDIIDQTTMPLFDHFWINRSITKGVQATNPTFALHEFFEGERVILLSDGLSDSLTTQEIERIMQTSGTPQEKAQELVMHAYEASKFGPKGPPYRTKVDDVTAVVIE